MGPGSLRHLLTFGDHALIPSIHHLSKTYDIYHASYMHLELLKENLHVWLSHLRFIHNCMHGWIHSNPNTLVQLRLNMLVATRPKRIARTWAARRLRPTSMPCETLLKRLVLLMLLALHRKTFEQQIEFWSVQEKSCKKFAQASGYGCDGKNEHLWTT